MRRTRWNRQDGFIREVAWLVIVVGVLAVVLLDAVALFNAHQSSHDDASSAAREAQSAYVQSQSLTQARQAAAAYLTRSGQKLVAFKTLGVVDGSMAFQITDTMRAKTYAFKYLAHVPGMKKWVEGMLNPVSTESTAD